jgi:hypothetical protein
MLSRILIEMEKPDCQLFHFLVQFLPLSIFIVALVFQTVPKGRSSPLSVLILSDTGVHRTRIAVITTAIGYYEKRTRMMTTQTVPVDYYCFTDSHAVANPGNWTMDYTPYHLLGFSRLDTGNFRNSFVRNRNPYMVYKFSKTQFYHFPCLRGYDMIVWTDMTW